MSKHFQDTVLPEHANSLASRTRGSLFHLLDEEVRKALEPRLQEIFRLALEIKFLAIVSTQTHSLNWSTSSAHCGVPLVPDLQVSTSQREMVDYVGFQYDDEKQLNDLGEDVVQYIWDRATGHRNSGSVLPAERRRGLEAIGWNEVRDSRS
jgi:hypothetical protein